MQVKMEVGGLHFLIWQGCSFHGCRKGTKNMGKVFHCTLHLPDEL